MSVKLPTNQMVNPKVVQAQPIHADYVKMVGASGATKHMGTVGKAKGGLPKVTKAGSGQGGMPKTRGGPTR